MEGGTIVFKEWLEEKGALADYTRNRLSMFGEPKYKAIAATGDDWLMGAFRWRTTRRGFDYWGELDNEWRNLIGWELAGADPGMPLDDELGMRLLLSELEDRNGIQDG